MLKTFKRGFFQATATAIVMESNLLVKRRIASFVSRILGKNKEPPSDPVIYTEFTSDRDLWDARYSSGGKSGPGSIGENKKWKWNQVSQYVNIAEKDVLDVGCGDLSFWSGHTCRSYTGIDFSKTIIHQNKLARPDWHFILGSASDSLELSASVVLCLDMLFHVMDDSEYQSILRNLAKWSTEWLFIYTWWQSPFEDKNTDDCYQIYRPLLDSLNLLAPLEFIAEHRHTDIGALYIFKRTR